MGELENDRYKGRKAVSYCQASTNLQIIFFSFVRVSRLHELPCISPLVCSAHETCLSPVQKKCQSYIQEI